MEEVVAVFEQVFGTGDVELGLFQVLARAVTIFIIGIALVRIGRKRFLGKMTAFDMIIAVVLGSLLSRSITREELFLEMLAAALLLILLHRSFSYLADRSHTFGKIIKGHQQVLVKDGEIIWEALRDSSITEHDLMQTLRLNANTADVSKVKIARLERNGDISFLMKADETEDPSTKSKES